MIVSKIKVRAELLLDLHSVNEPQYLILSVSIKQRAWEKPGKLFFSNCITAELYSLSKPPEITVSELVGVGQDL